MGRSSGRTPTGLSRVSQISGGQGIGSGLCGAEGYKEQSKVGGSSVAHTTWGSSPRETEQGAGSRSSTEQGAGSRSSTEQGPGHSPHGTKQGSPHASVYEELSVVKAGSFFFPGDQMKYLPKFIMPLLLFGKMDHALVWILC